MGVNALNTIQGRGMALTYQINRRINEYEDCGYDPIGLARRKVLRAEIDELRSMHRKWAREHAELLKHQQKGD